MAYDLNLCPSLMKVTFSKHLSPGRLHHKLTAAITSIQGYSAFHQYVNSSDFWLGRSTSVSKRHARCQWGYYFYPSRSHCSIL